MSTACSAIPEDYGPSFHRVSVEIGGLLVGQFDTDLRLDSKLDDPGTYIDLEDDLGLDEQGSALRIGGEWRFSRRSAVEIDYYDIERHGSRTLLGDLQIGGTLFPGGIGVDSHFATTIVKGSYRHTLFVGEDWELGASLGLHTMDLSFGVAAKNVMLEEDFSAILPLPVLGIGGRWEVVDDVILSAKTDLFYLQLENVGSTEEIKGVLSDTLLGVEWEFWDHLGVGAAYNFFYMSIDTETDTEVLDTDFDFHGLFLYLSSFF